MSPKPQVTTGKDGKPDRAGAISSVPVIGEPFIPQVTFTKEKGYFGPIFPLVLLAYPHLSNSAKLIWAALASCAGRNGNCFPSYTKLAEMTGMSLRQAKNATKELMEMGFLKWDMGGPGRSNRYYLLWHSTFEEARRKNLKVI